MSSAFDDGPINQPDSRHAAEWGFASLLLGGFLAMLSMMLLILNLHLFLSPPIWGASDLRSIHYVSIVGAVMLPGTCGLSVSFAVRSLASAYRHGQPTALGWSGLLISVLALLLWIGALVDLFSVMDTMMRRQGMPGIF